MMSEQQKQALTLKLVQDPVLAQTLARKRCHTQMGQMTRMYETTYKGGGRKSDRDGAIPQS